MPLQNLPPAMTPEDLRDFLMSPAEPFTLEERDAWEGLADEIVREIFAGRGNPRSIISPLAVHLAEVAVHQVRQTLEEKYG